MPSPPAAALAAVAAALLAAASALLPAPAAAARRGRGTKAARAAAAAKAAAAKAAAAARAAAAKAAAAARRARDGAKGDSATKRDSGPTVGSAAATDRRHARRTKKRAAKRARRVYVGVYLADISGFDLSTGRFKADLHLWVKWLGDPRAPPVSLANAEVRRRVLLARENDGEWHSVRWRVQATMRGVFSLHHFPFDRQKLRVEVELPLSEGRLVPDSAGSGMSPTFSITGWLYQPYFKSSVSPVTYYSDFGSIAREGRPRRMRHVTFLVTLQRPVLTYVLKFLLPLIIILLMATLAFFIGANQIGVRVSMGVTALLSSVAFQFSQSDSLPDVSYLMMIDKVFLAAYVLILLSLIVTVISHNIIDKHPRRSRRLDRLAAAALPLSALVTGLLLVRAPHAGHVDDEDAAAVAARRKKNALPTTPKNRPPSARHELRVSVLRMKRIDLYQIQSGLLRRGLTYRVGKRSVPHLARATPELTNDLVRFLPDGGMVVRWALRQGMRWSDGKPITGADLAYSATLPRVPQRRAVKVVDPLTVDVHYSVRRGRFLAPFALYPRAVVEPVVKKGGRKGLAKWLRTHAPPGDGPYRIKRYDRPRSLLLERNPFFAGVEPRIARVRFVTGLRGAVGNNIIAGKTDLVSLIGPVSYGILARSPKGGVRSDRYDRMYFLQPDLSVAPWKHLGVRRALLHAIDRRAAGALVFGDAARAAHSFRPAWADDYAAGVRRYRYDPERAKALLRAAGLTPPLPIKIIARRMRKDGPERVMLEKVVRDLVAGGFEAHIAWHKRSTFGLWKRGDHGALLFFSRSGPNPARYFNVPYSKGRYAVDTPTPRFDRHLVGMYRRYRRSIFVERRVAISRQLQRIFAERLPVVPLFFGQRRSGFAADLAGWDPTGGATRWWNVEHWTFKPRTSAPARQR